MISLALEHDGRLRLNGKFSIVCLQVGKYSKYNKKTFIFDFMDTLNLTLTFRSGYDRSHAKITSLAFNISGLPPSFGLSRLPSTKARQLHYQGLATII